MAKVEVDETELRNYQQVFNAVRAGLANPKTRPKLLEVQAELTPETASPEITFSTKLSEVKNEILDEIGKIREESAKEKADREAADERSRLASRWNESRAAASAQGYTAEGLEKLEKFMEDHGVADHRIAIPAFEKDNPPATPLMNGGQRWDFFGAKETQPPDLKALLAGDDEAFLGPAIADALAQVRNQR